MRGVLDGQRLAQIANRWVLWVTRHWLAVANSALALVLGLAFLAPGLMLSGHPGAGQFLYLLYRPLCHQLPERSFFLGGAAPCYTLGQLSARLGYEVPARYIGNPELGYKVAFCERDVAIYAGYLLAGLAFACVRRRLQPLPWKLAALMAAPMAVDGLVQLFGLAESNWFRRSVTGLLFGVAVVWFAFPWLERGMRDAQEIAAQGLEATHAGDR